MFLKWRHGVPYGVGPRWIHPGDPLTLRVFGPAWNTPLATLLATPLWRVKLGEPIRLALRDGESCRAPDSTRGAPSPRNPQPRLRPHPSPHGAGREANRAGARAEQLEGRQVHLAFQSCDDSTAQLGKWDSANARPTPTPTPRHGVVGVIGTFNSGLRRDRDPGPEPGA